MTRVSLRYAGEVVGKKAALPASFEELLELATQKLQLLSPAKRIFSSDGDEYDADGLDLIHLDDILYVTCGENFSQRRATRGAGQMLHLDTPAQASATQSMQPSSNADYADTVINTMATHEEKAMMELVTKAKKSLASWARLAAPGGLKASPLCLCTTWCDETANAWSVMEMKLGGAEGVASKIALASMDANNDGRLSEQEVAKYRESGSMLVEMTLSFCLSLGVVAALIISVAYPLAFRLPETDKDSPLTLVCK